MADATAAAPLEYDFGQHSWNKKKRNAKDKLQTLKMQNTKMQNVEVINQKEDG